MKKGEFQRKTRKAHRFLGVALGIQFLFWTMGGLYFSWSDMAEIHRDHHKAHIHPLGADLNLVNPQTIIQKIKEKDSVNFVFDLKLIQFLGQPVYQITYSNLHDSDKKIQLANAQTGELRNSLTENEAVNIAKNSFSKEEEISKVEYLTTINGHHEYRVQPLPAYAVTFGHSSGTTVYVAADLGTVQKFRNNKWRVFDFL